MVGGLDGETVGVVDNMGVMAAIDGVDALFMGVRDLCLSLGLDVLSAAYDTPEIDAVVEKMIAVSKESGVALGIHAFSVEELQFFMACCGWAVDVYRLTNSNISNHVQGCSDEVMHQRGCAAKNTCICEYMRHCSTVHRKVCEYECVLVRPKQHMPSRTEAHHKF